MQTLERLFVLPPLGELRIVTARTADQPTRVLLHQETADDSRGAVPRADLFGTELVPAVPVQLPVSRSLSIFSPTGCRLTVTAPPSVLQRCYATASGGIWMRSVTQLHSHLQVERIEARSKGHVGPRVLFVSDRRYAGTSTYAQLLAQYAVRLGYHPLLIDAVPEHPRFGYPSCISLFHLQHTIDIEEGTSFMPAEHTLCTRDRRTSPRLFIHCLRQLLDLATEKMARNDRCRVGGLFVDYGVVSMDVMSTITPTGTNGADEGNSLSPLDTLLDTIVDADIDHVVVVQSSWLRFKLAQRAYQRFSGKGVDKMLMAPFTVTCEQELAFRLTLVDGLDLVNPFDSSAVQRARWMQYFFGTSTSPVKPTLLNIDLSRVRLAAVGGHSNSSMHTLMPMDDDETSVTRADPAAVNFLTTQDAVLKGRIVAISTATEVEALQDGSLQRVPFAEFERRIRACHITGFALVESVTEQKMTLLLCDAPIHKEVGLCLLLTEEFLGHQR